MSKVIIHEINVRLTDEQKADLRTRFSESQIQRAESKLIGLRTSDHQPCGVCGGTTFLRTGTCHVCQTCGSSQGCS